MINLHKRMFQPRRGLNPQPPGLQSDGTSKSMKTYAVGTQSKHQSICFCGEISKILILLGYKKGI